jgi:hypothetical protein
MASPISIEQQSGDAPTSPIPSQSRLYESEEGGSENVTVSSGAPNEATPSSESVQDVTSARVFDGQRSNPVRKFKPQLIETSSSQSGERRHARLTSESDISHSVGVQPQPKPIRRFVPELLETSTALRAATSTPFDSQGESFSRRRAFTPQLVEISQRSRNSTDTKPASIRTDSTDATPTSPVVSTLEARKFGIALPRRTLSQSSTHSHSYKTPDLGTIESSESDSSAQPSPITSSSPSPASFSYLLRARDSIDHQSTGYLLALAAKNAQRQLCEQALAAFPNDDRHQPVTHYVDHLDRTPAPSSRGSHYELDSRRQSSSWDLKETQKHHEMLETERAKERRRPEARRKLHKRPEEDAWKAPPGLSQTKAKVSGKNEELRKMLDKARPPMLGKDLVFPRSQSPDPARFDVTQGPESLKRTMCYLSNLQERLEPGTPSLGGLWCAQALPKPESVASYQWSRPVSRTTSQQGGGGLWGGSCIETGLSPPSSRPTGIMTPRFDEEFSNTGATDVPNAETSTLPLLFPPSPPPSNSGIASSLEERIETEASIEAEFDDRFVTQVYNYLSLGYPAIARDFDEELAKISRISIADLRQDDDLPTGARGYIRLGEEELCNGVTEDMCTRWKALRIYVLEWARQQPNMAKPKDVQGNWVAARKGSWAW